MREALARSPRFARFLAVGVAGFVVDAGLSTLLVAYGHLPPPVARIPAFVAASIVTYTANRRLTFGDRQVRFWPGWLRYVASTSLGALLNYATFALLVSTALRGPAGVVPAIAAGSVIGLGFNYACSVRLVFR